MNERYIATADLGSSKIAVSITRMEGNDIQVVYYRETPSRGIRYSTVFNPTQASEPLREAIRNAEEELGIKVTQLVIGLPRYSIRQENGTANYQRPDPQSCISGEEITFLKDKALDSYSVNDENKEEIYGAVAQSFSTDDLIQAPENDVIGIPSESVSGNFKIFVGSRRAVSNIDILIHNVGIGTAFRYFLPDVTAKAVLTPQEMDNGVALVEMGAGVTSITIYQRGILRYFGSIPFGAKNITTDIRYECGITESLAENIKLAYGACIPEKLLTMGEKILQICNDESGECQNLAVRYLSEIITARAREIINAVLFQIQESGYADRLRSGIVLTGGGANLVNLTNLMKDMSGYNVRLGFPRSRGLSADGLPELSETGAAATVGMILAAKDNPYINCIQTADVKSGTGSGTDDETDNTTGTVFDQVHSRKEKRLRQKKEKGRNKSRETQETESGETDKVSWGEKINETIGDLFDGTFGSLFDEMK